MTVGDVLTGWATVPRHVTHYLYLQSAPLDGDIAFPAATDQAATAAVAVTNVLLVGGGVALVRRGRRIGRSGPIAGGVALALVVAALAAVGTLAALAPEFFFFAVLGL